MAHKSGWLYNIICLFFLLLRWSVKLEDDDGTMGTMPSFSYIEIHMWERLAISEFNTVTLATPSIRAERKREKVNKVSEREVLMDIWPLRHIVIIIVIIITGNNDEDTKVKQNQKGNKQLIHFSDKCSLSYSLVCCSLLENFALSNFVVGKEDEETKRARERWEAIWLLLLNARKLLVVVANGLHEWSKLPLFQKE